MEWRGWGVDRTGELARIGLCWPQSRSSIKSLSNDWVSKWHSPVGCCYFVYSSGELMGKNLSRCYDHSVEDRGEAG